MRHKGKKLAQALLLVGLAFGAGAQSAMAEEDKTLTVDCGEAGGGVQPTQRGRHAVKAAAILKAKDDVIVNEYSAAAKQCARIYEDVAKALSNFSVNGFSIKIDSNSLVQAATNKLKEVAGEAAGRACEYVYDNTVGKASQMWWNAVNSVNSLVSDPVGSLVNSGFNISNTQLGAMYNTGFTMNGSGIIPSKEETANFGLQLGYKTARDATSNDGLHGVIPGY